MQKLLILFFLILSPTLFSFTLSPDKVIHKEPLSTSTMAADPLVQLGKWYEDAERQAGRAYASTFVLSTVSADCTPSSRSMIAKIIDRRGIAFFGDMRSQKMNELKINPVAAATFYWANDQRQITMTGRVTPVTAKINREVFASRARESQISSMIFEQDREIPNLKELHKLHAKASGFHEGKTVPTPSSWGGFWLEPDVIEFWQAGAYNIHSRIQYKKSPNGEWEMHMLAP